MQKSEKLNSAREGCQLALGKAEGLWAHTRLTMRLPTSNSPEEKPICKFGITS